MLAHVEVDIQGRWDAVALSERLVAYRSHLVEFAGERWRVYAATPGYHDEQLPDALSAIERCLRERRVEDAVVRIEWRPHHRELEPETRRESAAAALPDRRREELDVTRTSGSPNTEARKHERRA